MDIVGFADVDKAGLPDVLYLARQGSPAGPYASVRVLAARTSVAAEAPVGPKRG